MRLVICALYYVGNVMVLAEKDFAPDLQSDYRFVKILWLSFLTLLLVFSANNSFAADWTPCEAPCNDIYTNIYTPSPASGSSHPAGNTVQFTINAVREGSYDAMSYLPFNTEVSLSGAGIGWSTSTIAPVGAYCIWADDAYSSDSGCVGYSNSTAVNIVIDVTIGTGAKRVTVKLANTNTLLVSPVFYFDVSASGAVRVTGLTDMPSTWNGSGDEENNDNICVYSSEGTYDLLVEGTVDSGSYVLAEGGGTKIPITVYWNNTSGTSGRTLLDSADDPSLTGVTGGDTSSQTCSGGNTANISWKALEADLQTKPAGTYSATMTITTSAP